MAIKAMADYLTSVAADYTDTTLRVTPQEVMPETGDIPQTVHRADDGTIAVVTKSYNQQFTVTLQWKTISESDAGIIWDMWLDSAKANGRDRTFYWQHPKEDNIYTVRFLEPIRRVYKSNMPSHMQVDQIKLHVEGVKP